MKEIDTTEQRNEKSLGKINQKKGKKENARLRNTRKRENRTVYREFMKQIITHAHKIINLL